MADNTKRFLDLNGLKYFWNEKVKKYNETLNKEIEVTVPVGNIQAGKLESGRTIVDVLETMLTKTFMATKKANPTCTLNTIITGGTSSFEVGTTVTLSLTSTYKDGTIQNYTGKTESAFVHQAAGCVAETPVYTKGGATVATGDTYKITNGNNTFTVSYKYAASTFDGKNSDGTSADLSIAAGTATASKNLTGSYYYFFKTFSDADYPGDDNLTRALLGTPSSSRPSTKMFDNTVIILAVPSGTTLKTAISANNEPQVIENLGTKQIADAGGDMHNYNVYKFTYAKSLGVNVTFTY